MDTVNTTPFPFATVVGRMFYPGHSMTLAVKGAFDLSPGGVAALAEEQKSPTGDEFDPNDEEMKGSLRYASDFACFKPKADLLLLGKCHVAGGQPQPICRVTFRVGSVTRSLGVVGDRHWKSGLLRTSMSEPVPFSEMDLRYERSFGGEKYAKNPVGRGYKPQVTEQGRLRLLPNIEDPDNPVDSPRSHPDPVGFGPLNSQWELRRSKLGTYKGAWLETRWPWFPEDFDWTHFNAAPPELQLAGYLRGDEEIYLENLHSEHAEYRARLPGIRVRCFLSEDEKPLEESLQKGHVEFREVEMKLDTLWVDAEAEKLLLVWRGHAAVQSEDYGEIRHLFIMAEPLEQVGHSREECRELFVKALAEEEAQWKEAPAEAPESRGGEDGKDAAAEPPAGVEDVEDDVVDIDAKLEEALTGLQAAVASSGLSPDLPPELESLKKEKEAEILARIESAEEDALAGDILGKNGKNGKPPAGEGGAEGESPEGSGGEAEPGSEPQPPKTLREIFDERVARRDSFAGEDLGALDLSGCRLAGLDFSGAIFTEVASLEGADLSGANLSGAVLQGAKLGNALLAQANLKEADLTGACLDGVDLSGAKLDGALLEASSLKGAKLDGASAAGCLLGRADLSAARLTGCVLDGADLTKSILAGADLREASLRGATVEGASGRKADMTGADLTELRASSAPDFSHASFRQAIGKESIWEKATLTGADFSYAKMEGANFTSAILQGANLYAADMKHARFVKADLREARLVRMNLFQGSLEKADLTDSDWSGSNMYGAEFLEATTDGTVRTGTNLKMTKLA